MVLFVFCQAPRLILNIYEMLEFDTIGTIQIKFIWLLELYNSSLSFETPINHPILSDQGQDITFTTNKNAINSIWNEPDCLKHPQVCVALPSGQSICWSCQIFS